jgi:protein transport protein SEC24
VGSAPVQGGPPSPEFQPTKPRRSARAYHQDVPDSSAYQQQPVPDRSDFTPTQISADAPPSYQQSSPQYSQHPVQHPYANAPPPGPSPVHSQGIPQPPHSTGQKLPGPRLKINPDQIPSPVAVREEDQMRFEEDAFLTCSRALVPLATTDFVAVDQGNSSPRFIRLTTYVLPASDDIASASKIPMGLVIQPFAALKPEEEPVPLVDFGESGPPRCSQCRGYINPWCTFIEGGQKFVCNLCGSSTPGKLFPPLFSPWFPRS